MSITKASDSATNFWATINKTKSAFDPNKTVIIEGKDFGKAKDLQSAMFKSCKSIEKLAFIFFQEKSPKRVVDLGCGSGANSYPFFKKGSSVVAIDSSFEQIMPYALQTLPVESRKGKLQLINQDITKMSSYGNDVDLVLAVDILPYLPPSSLQATMKKIHSALNKDGVLIGTLFLEGNKTVENFMAQVGAHFYRGGTHFITQFLKHSGFQPEQIERRVEGGFRFQAKKI